MPMSEVQDFSTHSAVSSMSMMSVGANSPCPPGLLKMTKMGMGWNGCCALHGLCHIWGILSLGIYCFHSDPWAGGWAAAGGERKELLCLILQNCSLKHTPRNDLSKEQSGPCILDLAIKNVRIFRVYCGLLLPRTCPSAWLTRALRQLWVLPTDPSGQAFYSWCWGQTAAVALSAPSVFSLAESKVNQAQAFRRICVNPGPHWVSKLCFGWQEWGEVFPKGVATIPLCKTETKLEPGQP